MMTLVLIVAVALASGVAILIGMYISAVREWDSLEAQYKELINDVSRRRSDCVSLNAQLLDKISDVNYWCGGYKRIQKESVQHLTQIEKMYKEIDELKAELVSTTNELRAALTPKKRTKRVK